MFSFNDTHLTLRDCFIWFYLTSQFGHGGGFGSIRCVDAHLGCEHPEHSSRCIGDVEADHPVCTHQSVAAAADSPDARQH